MTNKNTTSSMLALAVMGQLFERPMHPYEIASTMKERGKHETIKLKYGSLYTVVERLQKNGFIESRETLREGRRPERTVYGLTDSGREEYLDRLRRLLREPVKEYTQFAAGLTYIASVSPSEAVELLRERVRILRDELSETRSRLSGIRDGGVPRLFLIESEYQVVLGESELGWLSGLVEEISSGELEGSDLWSSFHDVGDEIRGDDM